MAELRNSKNMKNITSICLAGILVLTLCVSSTEACSCQPTHPQTAFCQADFVIKARVKSNHTIYTKTVENVDGVEITQRFPYQQMYHLHISRVFRESEAYKNSTKQTHLYTGLNGAMCGVQLQQDTKYLLAGFMIDDKPYISLCHTVMEWGTVPYQMRRGFSYLYEKNCDCQIYFCWAPKCEKRPHPSEICLYNMRTDTASCYQKHSICTKRGNSSRCNWNKPKALTHCLKEEEESKEEEENSESSENSENSFNP